MSNQTSQPQSRHEFESNLIAKAWKDEAFKQELIENTKAVYERELGQQLPENLKIRVMEETSDTLYLTLPKTPQVSEELSEEALEAVAGGRGHVVTPSFLVGW
ncbi:NHLP leader peptide family RiPP precursor [Scytonema sp. PCC 10023]|uniref:Nif11-type n=1 Tax=Scytonema sp. PCC 10023 TaxID=1680591 RepID=A0A2P0ZGZ2_9CYAN|nr:Nif11-type precursor [Scytonema sp. PCC 10023]